MTEKVTKLALTSRIILLIVQLIGNALVDDHKPDVFRAVITNLTTYTANNVAATSTVEATAPTFIWLDKIIQTSIGGLRNWDGEYFLHIAEHGYTYENTLAFYPLFPMLVRYGGLMLNYLCFGLSFRSCLLLAAVLLNLFFFCESANLLYNLTQRIFNDLNKSWYATLLFCINPASIFFTAAYSESLYCWLTLYLTLKCVTELKVLTCSALLALSFICRSNGLVNAGFPIYFYLRKYIVKPQSSNLLQLILRIIITVFLAVIPLTFFCSYAFRLFCQPNSPVAHSEEVLAYARKRNYILSGHRQLENSPWCDYSFPFSYSYIQSNYWNVGFMNYYELRQLPNFLIALPILIFLYYHCAMYLKHFIKTLWPKHSLLLLLKEHRSLPFVLQTLFLTLFSTFFAHIQISVRLLCSSTPCLYWFAADSFNQKYISEIRLRSKAGLILLWFSCYFLLGTTLFANNLPWT